MKTAANRGDYEQAAKFRNQFFGLRFLVTKIVFSYKDFFVISSDQALRDLQNLLKLEQPPRRIDGFDISHQSGTNVVASQVTFINGTADRTKYRKFRLRNQRNDDFTNMCEIITRRLNHLKDWGTPDLILIDGGEPQLRAVKDILDPAGIPYIGLAKELELIIIPDKVSGRIPIPGDGPETYRELLLSHNSHVVKLLQRVRDESHRFAIQYHTLLKRKAMLKSSAA
jgi:excinuclease ABC subunit C